MQFPLFKLCTICSDLKSSFGSHHSMCQCVNTNVTSSHSEGVRVGERGEGVRVGGREGGRGSEREEEEEGREE